MTSAATERSQENPDGPRAYAAPAKVNLCLRILGRRPDGYHLLDSLVVFAGVGDTLFVEPSPRLSLDLRGPFGSELSSGSDNLVLRAAHLLKEAVGHGAGAALVLEKHLPIAAGLGGGSSDAAATLLALDRLWRSQLGEEGLQGFAAALGADVPVCLHGRPSRVSGFGERLAPAPAMPHLWVVLVNPGVALATSTVFQARQGAFSPHLDWPERFAGTEDLRTWLEDAGNDLEAPARSLRPEIDDVLTALAATPNCLIARMSGSGATCFGLYGDAASSRKAAQSIAERHPAWWVRAAPVLEGQVGDGVDLA